MRKKTAQRLKIISGQVNGLIRMVEDEQYCIDILTQSLAIQNALKKVDQLVLEKHIRGCVIEQLKGGREKKAIEELTNLFSLSRR